MLALRVDSPGAPLLAARVEVPEPGPGELRIAVEACGVCRTDLHLLDGELPQARFPVVPGHQIAGRIERCGPGASGWSESERVGVSWLAAACGDCAFCRSGRENLCGRARFTGCHRDGGFAEFAVADARYCLRLPDAPEASAIAPWLCAGAIGYRCLRAAGDPERLGLYGFGAAAHLLTQLARFEGRRVFAFTRPGDREGQRFARELGAEWAGGSDQRPAEPLDAAILFAPAGELVAAALAAVDRGGTVVCGGIHMSDIPAFPYQLLWGERSLRSVANLTRSDAREYLALAARVPVRAQVQRFPLAEGARALEALRRGMLRGSAVLVPGA